MPSEALKEILKEDCFTEDCPHDEEMFTWVEFRCYEFKEALEKAYHLGEQNGLTLAEKEIEKVKAKWSRPHLDTVVGKETAEIVGSVAEHIADEIIERLSSTQDKVK